MKVIETLNILDSPSYTVICLTYNHRKFIEEAISSIFNQEIDRVVEILVIDDCSTDGTSAYLSDLAEKFQNFYHLKTDKNLFGTPQHAAYFERTFNVVARGEFIFYLELDDVWTDLKKMIRQAECLRRQAGVSFCFHEYVQVDESGQKLPFKYPDSARRGYSTEELLSFSYAYILMSTCAFRKTSIAWPIELYITRNGDMFFPAHYGRIGPAVFMSDINPHHYRIHGRGFWSGTSDLEKKKMKLETAILMLHQALRRDDHHSFATTFHGRFSSALRALFGNK